MMDGLLTQFYAVSYNVSDWQRAKRFYGETLGLPVAAFMNDEVGWMEFGEKDGTHIAINFWRGPDPLPKGDGGGVAIFSVKDAIQAIADLRKRGVRCEDPVPVPDMVTWANFYDPDGNRLQVAGPPPQKVTQR
jgi:predicted enzyme related to lactoylglutathione lyase